MGGQMEQKGGKSNETDVNQPFMTKAAGIILWMRPANERQLYIVTSPLVGWAHT